MIAALYVEPNGAYASLPDVDVWSEDRDARAYFGPHPVVAHPPCAAWSVYAPARAAIFGLPAGEDGGCFAHALWAVRALGGVLEHPARSSAFRKYGLPIPSVSGAWSQTTEGEWVAEVNQGLYGHRLSKPTWLYYVGNEPPAPLCDTPLPPGLRTVDGVTSAWRSPTPPAFRDYLIGLARSVEAWVPALRRPRRL